MLGELAAAHELDYYIGRELDLVRRPRELHLKDPGY